ncbi:hypothetical protein AAG570_002228 [Ranatra chinensis]|uniref:Neutral ceramidase n=1 Tax=Ranatra chinensis TaxID=642074 RepID=A0ABD0Y6W5_9HEMI
MGYANPEQKGSGIHLRQFSRSFIIEDTIENTRLVFVSNDCGMMGTGVRLEVIKKLKTRYGNETYNESNVMLSGTHSHSTPGGFLMDIIFDLNTFGFVRQTFDAYVEGIVRSISRAHENLTYGRIHMNRGEIHGASINRSPTAYLYNPPSERAQWEDNVDHEFTQLKFSRADDGRPMGVITWFAVHATSMNNTNRLVSADNVGYAALLFEQRLNADSLPGKGPFVAAFASTNLGDVSPNTRGPKCVPSGAECDPETSTCKDPRDRCIASGPGDDMTSSTSIIAHTILEQAWDTWQNEGEEIDGPLGVVHQYVDMPSQKVTLWDEQQQKNVTVQGCSPAMGYSFAAGTTDGPGAFSFKQSTKTTNPLWNLLTRFIANPSQQQIECHAPKPILIPTGELNFPFEWQPSVVSTQLAVVGNRLAIACVPGEFTTMSGRRMRNALSHRLALGDTRRVVIAGLCNTYSDYITTPDEYQAQRYEGASTIFGPHTLTIYLQQYSQLADHIIQGTVPNPGPKPPTSFNDLFSLLPGVVFDSPGWRMNFGDVLKQPQQEVRPGETVKATFVAGNPRNDLMQESSFVFVQARKDNNTWVTVATDANWETKFIWRRSSTLLGTSQAEVLWTVPQGTTPGSYRIVHQGHYKPIVGTITSYSGISNTFKVSP